MDTSGWRTRFMICEWLFTFIYIAQCMLTDDLSQYLLPDVNIVERFHEVLEYPTLRGVIITQTASDNVRVKTTLGKTFVA